MSESARARGMAKLSGILDGLRFERENGARIQCPDGHHDHIRAFPMMAWELLELVGRQWVDGEVEGTEEHVEQRNCGRCHTTIGRVIATRLKPGGVVH